MTNTIMIGGGMNVNRIHGRPGAAVTLVLSAYSAALAVVLLATLPLWVRELRRGGKYREGFFERLGRVPGRLMPPPPAARVVWVHAVSVGELLAAVPLIEQLQAREPGLTVYLSTTTRTAQAIGRQRFHPGRVFYFPADFAVAVRPWLRFLKPSLIVLLESELWPRFLTEAARAAIPVAVVNGRISARSWPSYQRLRGFWQLFLRRLTLVHTQTAEDTSRFRALGAPVAVTAGNLKYDLPIPATTPLRHALVAQLPVDTTVIVCGSTLEGEEALLLQAIPPHIITLLAPRHPQRFGEVATLVEALGRPWNRLSAWRHQPRPLSPGTILLLDSVGELAPLYAIATVAIVGGGFLHPGGHNPLEPAILGKPILIGPGSTNFRAIVDALVRADAIRVCDPMPHTATSTGVLLQDILDRPDDAAALGARAQAVCAQHAGATTRACEALLQVLGDQTLRQRGPEPRPESRP